MPNAEHYGSGLPASQPPELAQRENISSPKCTLWLNSLPDNSLFLEKSASCDAVYLGPR
jgi:hypothetical protein